jgi:extracellular solute-binding protein (family 3)
MAGLLTTDLSTLFNDLLAQADPTQLRADLTAVVSDVRASPPSAAEIRTFTSSIVDPPDPPHHLRATQQLLTDAVGCGAPRENARKAQQATMDNGVGRGKPMRLRTEAASSRGLRHEAGEEKAMKDIDRRSAVALGVAAATAIVGRTAVAKEWTKLRLGISADDPPNSSVRPDGTLQGFEIDLAGDICKRMKVECEWVRQDFEGLIPALRQGKFDVIFTLLAITPKRREAINFSIPIAGERGEFW